MKPVSLGVVGCGVAGSKHIKAAVESDLLNLIAVADRVEERTQEIARNFGVKKVYSDGEALLEDRDVEAVVLALPAGLRTALALRAFSRGKHVLL